MSEAHHAHEAPRAGGLTYAGIREAAPPARHDYPLRRVACHKCGRPTVTTGRGVKGKGALCSSCRAH